MITVLSTFEKGVLRMVAVRRDWTSVLLALSVLSMSPRVYTDNTVYAICERRAFKSNLVYLHDVGLVSLASSASVR